MDQPNLYQVLGVPHTASTEQVTEAFRKAAQQLQGRGEANDPAVEREYRLLSRAYQVLRDPVARKQYHEMLAEEGEYPEELALTELWQQTIQHFFEQSERYTPAIDGLRATVPLTMEGENLLIVGIDPAQATLLSYLNATDVHLKVRRILSALHGSPLEFRIIVGATLQDWEIVKQGEEHLKQKRNGALPESQAEAPSVTPTPEAASAAPAINWDKLVEHIIRQWSATENRSFPQVRARFMLDHLADITQLEDAGRASGLAEAALQRGVARALDRLGSITNVDSNLVALEYLRYRARIHGGER